MALVSFKNTILHNLVSKPKTRRAEKEYPVGTRGHVENDMDVCVLCGLCSIKCPTHAITASALDTAHGSDVPCLLSLINCDGVSRTFYGAKTAEDTQIHVIFNMSSGSFRELFFNLSCLGFGKEIM